MFISHLCVQVQRYEAASTLYGPHTLDVFINKFVELTTAIIEVSIYSFKTKKVFNQSTRNSLKSQQCICNFSGVTVVTIGGIDYFLVYIRRYPSSFATPSFKKKNTSYSHQLCCQE